MATRSKRVTKPGPISVEVDKVTTRSLSATSAEASFIQHYTSQNYKDAMNKTLQYQLENGQWKIVRETNR